MERVSFVWDEFEPFEHIIGGQKYRNPQEALMDCSTWLPSNTPIEIAHDGEPGAWTLLAGDTEIMFRNFRPIKRITQSVSVER